jgi:hypothetical protein
MEAPARVFCELQRCRRTGLERLTLWTALARHRFSFTPTPSLVSAHPFCTLRIVLCSFSMGEKRGPLRSGNCPWTDNTTIVAWAVSAHRGWRMGGGHLTPGNWQLATGNWQLTSSQTGVNVVARGSHRPHGSERDGRTRWSHTKQSHDEEYSNPVCETRSSVNSATSVVNPFPVLG